MAGDCRLVVRIDSEKCQGHARCHALAPELFELDQLGNARIRGSGLVPLEHQDKVWVAHANCPEQAIVIDVGAQRAGRISPA